MATKKNTDQEVLSRENIEETVSKAEQFFNENKKTIWGVIIAAVVLVILCIAYGEFIAKPKIKEAMEQMYPAESSFAQGEYELALNGDGNVMGFNDIMAEYGAKGGKDIYLYTGICNLKLGNYDEAIKDLKRYKGKDAILAARAEACIGDAYVGLENYAEGIRHFMKAAERADNMFAAEYLLKAGVANEELGNTKEALKCYKAIKEKYPESMQGYDIDKYISRIEAE